MAPDPSEPKTRQAGHWPKDERDQGAARPLLAGPEGGLATTRLVGSVTVLVVAAGTVTLTVLFVAALTIALELASDTLLGRLRFLDSGLRIVGRFSSEATQFLQNSPDNDSQPALRNESAHLRSA